MLTTKENTMAWKVYRSNGWGAAPDELGSFALEREADVLCDQVAEQYTHLPFASQPRIYVQYKHGDREPAPKRAYVVCNRLLNPETWQHCEFDGVVDIGFDMSWRCPGCHWLRHGIEYPVTASA